MTAARLYGTAVLGRYGLTHGMLAWARCRLWCEQNGATMVAPFWFKLRIGPYLRRERDKRNYFLLFGPGKALSGARRLAVLARSVAIDVGIDWPALPPASDRPQLLRFHNALKDNEKKSFAQIVGHGAFLRHELIAITRSRFLPLAETTPFIAIHVRLGDFKASSSDMAIDANATNTRLPINWYGDRLAALRAALGRDVRALVFSDGTDADLAPLLACPAVTRAPIQQSVTDLLHMGTGVALIASGSGFSLWGAFLGSTPRLSHPGQSIVPIHADPTMDIESAEASDVPALFVAHVRARLTG
jgi:hypothetical protein